MDLDAVTSSVCGITHFEGLPVYGKQHRKYKANQKTADTVLSFSFQEKSIFHTHRIMVTILRIPI